MKDILDLQNLEVKKIEKESELKKKLDFEAGNFIKDLEIPESWSTFSYHHCRNDKTNT